MQSTYRQRVSVYRKGETETSPEPWLLIAERVPISIRPLNATGRLEAEALFGVRPRNPISHRGRCEYHEEIQAGRDRVFLRDEDTGQQYLVANAVKGIPPRGGNSPLTLHLAEQDPPYQNLEFA